MNVMHMLFSHNYNYLIIARNDFFKWMKWRAIINVIAEIIMKFLWKDIFCKHETSWKMMINEDFKNKWEVKALLAKFKIKKVMISAYHLQINDMIEHEHISIMQALSKSCENQLYQWRYYMLAVTWIDRIIICKSTNMNLYCFFHDENLVLLIELSVLI